MKFTAVNKSHIEQISCWVDSQDKLFHWAGPFLSYPLNIETLMSDLDLESKPAYCLIADNEELLGFGQFYQRLAACHLGRLIVSPNHRGKALIADLIEQLVKTAAQNYSFNTVSLFVYTDNPAAINAYKKLGFENTHYPEKIPFENCIYMTKSLI